VILLLAACGKLSPEEAQRLVVESEQFKTLPTATFFDGYATRGGGDALYDGLVDMRLVVIRPGPSARLTRLGQQRIGRWSSAPNQYAIPLATGRRITSVRVANLAEATADAEVRWTYDLTDIGQSVANRDRTDHYRLGGDRAYRASFRKYDDGWRLEEFTPK